MKFKKVYTIVTPRVIYYATGEVSDSGISGIPVTNYDNLISSNSFEDFDTLEEAQKKFEDGMEIYRRYENYRLPYPDDAFIIERYIKEKE